MCGRFTLRTGLSRLVAQFQIDDTDAVQLKPRYNIAPTQPVAAVRAAASEGNRQLVLLRWGLIPSWSRDPSIGSRLINARAETVADKPAFRGPFRRRRCLILADGYYEWKKTGSGAKQPYYIRRIDGRPFAMAGLWDRWQAPDRQAVESCAIITTEANKGTRAIHDRMPAILAPQQYDLWLDPTRNDPNRLLPLLAPAPSDQWTAYPVGSTVNNPRHETADCIRPVEHDS